MPHSRYHVRARLESPDFDCSRVELHRLKGREAISEPFAFELDVTAPQDPPLDGAKLLGKAASIVLSQDDADVRTIHGIVAETVDEAEGPQGRTRHRLRIVPRLHRLTLGFTCEVFLGKSVLEIALDKLARAGLVAGDVRPQLAQTPKASEFHLQYCESDLAFVSRHLERAGISYFFDHSGGKDVLVLSDGNAAFAPTPGGDTFPYVREGDKWGITRVEVRSAMMPSRHRVDDYLPRHPKLALTGEHTLGAFSGAEVNDFGTGQVNPKEAKELAEMRALSRHALAFGVECAARYVPQIESGRTLSVDEHPQVDSGRMLVVWVEHELLATREGESEPSYQARFRLVDTREPYRPPLRTPWPRIAGYVHAVTDDPPPGASGLDPVIDEEGRYTIRFYFDRADGTKRRTSSAPVRMLQPHAGAGYGMHFPLKPGVEVAVAFMEGDPDRPIILGAAHNGLNRHVVTSANAKLNQLETRSGIHIRMKDS